MSENTSMLAASLPPISKEAFEKLAYTFPAPIVQPGAQMDELQYAAGAYSVIEWIRHHMLREQIITGKVDVSQSVKVKG